MTTNDHDTNNQRLKMLFVANDNFPWTNDVTSAEIIDYFARRQTELQHINRRGLSFSDRRRVESAIETAAEALRYFREKYPD